MILLPAIDIYEGRAVRLLKGSFADMTIYDAPPEEYALDFKAAGAKYAHMVDLEGARDGGTPNFDVIRRVIELSGLNIEVGGGIRDVSTVEKYLNSGAYRVILGTAALSDPKFLTDMVRAYGERIAVSVDISNGCVALKGWTELSRVSAHDFMERIVGIGVRTAIVTDIIRDGALKGANCALYAELARNYNIDIIASGGVNGMDDIAKLKLSGAAGAIVGKAYYTRAINLKQAVELAL